MRRGWWRWAFALAFAAAPGAWVSPAGAQVADTTLWVTDGTVNAVARDGNTIYVGGTFTRVGPVTGGGVPLSAADGELVRPFPKVTGEVVQAVSDGSGGWFIAGDFVSVGGLPRPILAHILADGGVAGWNPSVEGVVRCLALSGNTIYLGGQFDRVDGQPRSNLAAVDATTGRVTPWDPGANNAIFALTLNGNTIYAGGFFTRVGGQARNFIAALDARTGIAADWDAALCSDGFGGVEVITVRGPTVYVAGDFTRAGGQTRNRLVALDAVTAQPTGWDPKLGGAGVDCPPDDELCTPGPLPFQSVSSLAARGSVIYAGGQFVNIGGQPRHNIAALDATTGLATAWDPNADRAVLALAVHGSTIYAGGWFTSIGGQPRADIAALDAATGRATAWAPDMNYVVITLALHGAEVFAGGGFTSVGGLTRNNIAALDATTGLPTAWDPNAGSTVSALAVSGSNVYVGGAFLSIGGQPRSHIAAVDATTGFATAWDPNANSDVFGLALGEGVVYAGGNFSNIGGKSAAMVAALDITTALAATPTPAPPDAAEAYQFPALCLAATAERVYVGGYYWHVAGQSRRALAAISPGTGAVLPWDPAPDGYVKALAVRGSTLYVGGQFENIGGQPRHNLAALDAATGLATPWDAHAAGGLRAGGGVGTVTALALDATTLYVGGDFTRIGGQERNDVAALDATTGLADPWNAQVNGPVRALALSGGTVYLGGDFSRAAGQPQAHLAALTAATTGGRAIVTAPSLDLIQGRPNPGPSRTTIRFTLPAAGPVTLAIYDIEGRLVSSVLARTPRPAGVNEVTLQTEGWPAGIYLCRLEHGETRLTGKIIVVR